MLGKFLPLLKLEHDGFLKPVYNAGSKNLKKGNHHEGDHIAGDAGASGRRRSRSECIVRASGGRHQGFARDEIIEGLFTFFP
jgi:hypothetical protein